MEKVVLADFELDTARIQKNLDDLQNKFYELRKEQETYNKVYTESNKAMQNLSVSMEQLKDEGKENSDEFKELDKQMEAFLKVNKDAFKSQQNLQGQMGRVRTEINTLVKATQAYMDAEGKQVSLIDLGNKALERQVNTRNEAKAAVIELRRIGDQLNVNIEEEAALLTLLNQRIDQNTQFIKENASVTDQQKMNVGNYTESIKDAFNELNIFNGGLSGFIQRSNEAGGAGNLIGNSFKGMAAGIGGATKAALAFIATPIGAVIAALAAVIGTVVGAFKLMTASMNSTEEGSAKLAKATAVVSGIFNGLWKIIKPLGEWLGDVFITTMDNAANAILKTSKMISGALKFLGFDDAAKTVSDWTGSVEKGIKASQELAQAEYDLAKAERNAEKVKLDYQKAAEKQRQIRDDESRSVKDRIAANEELGRVLKRQMNEELSIANMALKVAEIRIKAEGATTEALDARAAALTRISDIQERIVGQESEQLTNRNSLLKEAEEQRRAAAEAAVAQMELELQLYIANQGVRKKAMEEQLALDRKIADDSIAIAKKEYDSKLISLKEYQLRVAEANNTFAQSMVQITIDNADRELRVWEERNKRIVEGVSLLNDDLYQTEMQRLNDQAEKRAEFETAQYVQGVINLQEYQDRIREIDNEYNQSTIELENERAELRRAQEAANFALEQEERAEHAEINRAWQLEQEERRYQEQLEWAKKTGADIEAVERIHAANREKIEQTVMQNKAALASETFGNLAKIAGEESKMGKAFAVAQAIIDTYSSAVSSYNSLSGIPIVGPALGAVAAGAAVAMGMANVKKIVAVNPSGGGQGPRASYAQGVIGHQSVGSGTSDSSLANISNGESVITARATSMFPQTLSAINQMGGGVGIDGAVSSAIMQNTISETANSTLSTDQIVEAVAEATYVGTARGSQEGLVNLSSNREIQRNATF